jgi:hypothetical protein
MQWLSLLRSNINLNVTNWTAFHAGLTSAVPTRGDKVHHRQTGILWLVHTVGHESREQRHFRLRLQDIPPGSELRGDLKYDA